MKINRDCAEASFLDLSDYMEQNKALWSSRTKIILV